MTAMVQMVLLFLALVCFVLSAFGVPSRVDLKAAGLALWVATVLFGAIQRIP